MHCEIQNYDTGLMVCRGTAGDEVAFNCPKPHDAYIAPANWPEAWKWQTVVCGTMIRGQPKSLSDYYLVLHAAAGSPAVIAPLTFSIGLAFGFLLSRWRRAR
jgi:hypothetical protein